MTFFIILDVSSGEDECPVQFVVRALDLLVTGQYDPNYWKVGSLTLLEIVFKLIQNRIWPEPGGGPEPCEEYCLTCGKHGWPVWNSILEVYKVVCKLYSHDYDDLDCFHCYVLQCDMHEALDKAQYNYPIVYETSFFSL